MTDVDRKDLIGAYYETWDMLMFMADEGGIRGLASRLDSLEYLLQIENPAYGCECSGCKEEEIVNADTETLKRMRASAAIPVEDE